MKIQKNQKQVGREVKVADAEHCEADRQSLPLKSSESVELIGSEIVTATRKPRSYFIPAYSVRLVRDSSVKVESKAFDSPQRAVEIIRAYWGEGELDREHMICLLLDARYRVIAINTVSVGTLSASLVHPREVLKPAVLLGAAAFVVAHNHPSGDESPSREDREATRRLSRAGEIFGIPLLDHIILGDGKFFSFKEGGLL